eukprot:9929953-Alexandrium_andersonii.AAC.1
MGAGKAVGPIVGPRGARGCARAASAALPALLQALMTMLQRCGSRRMCGKVEHCMRSRHVLVPPRTMLR